MKPNPPAGLILIDKAAGFTSHHVVAYVRKLTKQIYSTDIKVGHLGTLDPFASGLLPILIGGVTRLSDDIMDGTKQYLFQIQFGVETDTLDTAGQVVKQCPVPENYSEKLQKILPKFIGEIEQVPPVYSALKMQGRPLYEYMRASGKLPCDIETKKRKIYIHKLDFIEAQNNCATLRVLCGKGTYVRSLARDLAYAIETVGHCIALRREYVEPWSVDKALVFSQEFKPLAEDFEKNIILPEEIIHVPKITIAESFSSLFCAGNIIFLSRADIAGQNYDELLKAKFCFAQSFNEKTMFYCLVEHHDENGLKIKPQKKIF